MRKKQKADKSRGSIPLVLTDGDIHEISEKVQEVTTKNWDRIDDFYKEILTLVQQGIAELKALPQTTR